MEPRAGCRLPARVEQVVNGALLVTASCGGRSFAGVLLDCTKKSGLFGLPSWTPPPLADKPPASLCHDQAPEEGPCQGLQPGTKPPPHPATASPEPPLPLPYFEGAPFPHPLWLRSSYQQWVPQPPPRSIKRTRRRLSRARDPGRLILSTIRLRPRQVLCGKCKSTVSPPQASASPPAAPRARRRLDPEEPQALRRSKRERREGPGTPAGQVPRSPVIRISYSTPQGKGEVVKIPSRVHGSLEPFCPPWVPRDGGGGDKDGPPDRPLASLPKLKLTRPSPALPPPKIRLRPRQGTGTCGPLYRAELVEALGASGDCSGPGPGLGTLSSLSPSPSPVSSGEEEDCQGRPHNDRRPGGLAFLVGCPPGTTDCSGDSLDEAKSSSSEGTSADPGDISSGDGATHPTVPPLTVRLHTQSVSKCVTDDGRTVAVGDIVWGKIHGFPWWPARVLDLSLGRKADGEPFWREAKVSWFGSPTTSLLSVSKLSPFSEFFKLRFNRKKKGMYRKAIAEAANAAGQHMAPEIRELLTQFET
ncbi:PWWP domain-containing protein 2B [Ochotona curzoniae]|uniref:PWWP domain-containing protein 2B n=1 Tax=Ochotona curzoniae TaxID=130825 RepID=UPI001B34E654|nr:PWWP domain-containing protein 2B [Ochotona curzoniae]